MSRAPATRRRLRRVFGPLAYLLIFLAGGVALLRMDPFGLTRLTKMYSQDLLAVAMAGCYPEAKPGKCVSQVATGEDHATAGRADVSVVLLRDDDLAAFDEIWPPRYGFHARVLKAIRANKPKAVVMDIVFEDVRDDPTIEALANELERYRQEGIPVYGAIFGADRPLRAEVAERVVPVLVPKRIDPLDRVTRFYDFGASTREPVLTAATTVYRDVCGGCAAGCEEGLVRIFWSATPPPGWNDRWLSCRRRPPFPWWIVQDRGSDFREDCPATATVPVRILLEPAESDDAEIEELIRDGIVLYGASFRGAPDAMNTPLHNEIPAVFLHAQALDNLITLGPEHLRHSEPQVPLLGVPLIDFILLLVIGVFFTLQRTSESFATGWRRLMSRVRFRPARVLLVIFSSQIGLLVLLASVASFVACHLGASEWIFGVNFLFAVTWTEVLDITEKLFEAADEFEP